MAPLIGAGAGLVAGGLGALLSELIGSKERGQADTLNREAYESLLNSPNPELRQLAASAFENIKLDPRYLDTQNSMLDALKRQADYGGMTPESLANLNQAQRKMEIVGRGQREAMMQDAARRGISNSGIAQSNLFAGQQAQQQGAADRALEIMANADRQRLGAIGQAAGLAGQIGEQQYGREANLARARDMISQTNLQQQNRHYQDQMDRARMIAEAKRGRAGDYSRESQRQRDIAGNALETFGRTANSVSGMNFGGMGGAGGGYWGAGGGVPQYGGRMSNKWAPDPNQ